MKEKEYVYFAYSTITNLIKIGKSTNPKQRVSNFKTIEPNIKLIYYTNKYTEKQLHETLKEYNIIREWFCVPYIILKEYIIEEFIPLELKNKNVEQIINNFIKNKEENNDIKEFDVPLIRKNEMLENYISYNKKKIKLTYCILGYEHYCFAENKQLYNTTTGRQIKKTMNCSSIGWWINKQFFTKNKLRPLLVKLKQTINQ